MSVCVSVCVLCPCGVAVCLDPERQKECEELLGPLPSERFAELVALGKLITDYVGEGETIVPNDEEGIDDDIGVAVEVGGRCL